MTPKEFVLSDRYHELISILEVLGLPFHEDLIISELINVTSTHIKYEVRYRTPRNSSNKKYNYLLYQLKTTKHGNFKIGYRARPSEDNKIRGADKFFHGLRTNANMFIEKKKKLELLVSKL